MGGAALIQVADRTLLFVTGSNGRVLLANRVTLGVAPETLDAVFLSHPYWDRLGGLDSILAENPRVTVILHAGFSQHPSRDWRPLCRELIVVESEPMAIAPGLLATGTLDSKPPERALILEWGLEWGGTTVAIASCAHPGMEGLVARAAALLGQPIDWAIGGFHLMDADAGLPPPSARSKPSTRPTSFPPMVRARRGLPASLRRSLLGCCTIDLVPGTASAA